MTDAGTSAETLSSRQRAMITLSVMLATIMQAIDTTIANVALPHMQGSMGVFQDQISWVLTSYILAAAIFIPLTGFLSARFGRKRLFITAVIGFTITSMLCGAAQNIYQIVFFRFMQGVFGAPLVPLSQAIMLDTYPRERQGSAMAMWGMGVMLGPILGPTLGGWLTEHYSWRWVFYINAPIGVLTFFGLTLFVKESAIDKKRYFDLLGFAFLSIGIGALQMMLDRGESLDWFNSHEVIVEAIVASLFLYLFIAHIFNHQHPFIDPHLFKDRNLSFGMLYMFLVGIVMLAVMALMPPFMQNLIGHPIVDVGILLAPRGAGTMFSMMVMGRAVRYVDSRLLIFSGMLMIAFSLWQMMHFNLDVPNSMIVWSGVIQGFGLGCIFVPLSTLTFATLPLQHRIEATPLYNLIRNLGSSIGVSVVITELSQNTQRNHAVFADYFSSFNTSLMRASDMGIIDTTSPTGLMAINGEVTRQALLLSYLQDFRLMMWLCLAAIPLLLLVRVPKTPPPVA